MRHALFAAATFAALTFTAPAFAAPAADTGSGVNTSATAASYAVGEAVKDSTGATIGRITDLREDATGQRAAAIRLNSGHEFQAPVSNLAPGDHAAVINLTQGQIEAALSANANGSPTADSASGAVSGAGVEGNQNHSSFGSGAGASGGSGRH